MVDFFAFLEIIWKRKGYYKKFANLYDRPAEPNYNANEKRYIANREIYESTIKTSGFIKYK